MHVKLHDVARAPLLSYNFISLASLALKGHTYAGDKDGVTLKLKRGRIVCFPLIGKLCRQYGYRPESKARVVDTACTAIAPRQVKNCGATSSKPQRGTPRVPGVFNGEGSRKVNGEGATKVHRQADAHRSRYPLPLPRPRSNCLVMPKRGRAQAGRARQVKAEGGSKTWTARPTST